MGVTRDELRAVLTAVLKDLRLEVDDRCRGHMAPTERYVVLRLGGAKLTEVKVMEDVYDESTGTWGWR